MFKNQYAPDLYVKQIKAPRIRSAIARFRCGVAPINIELGRYFNVPASERYCNFCPEKIENELHVLLHCTTYTGVRESLFKYASYISSDFMSMDDANKMTFIFTNNAMLLKCARTCYQILDIRKTLVTQV